MRSPSSWHHNTEYSFGLRIHTTNRNRRGFADWMGSIVDLWSMKIYKYIYQNGICGMLRCEYVNCELIPDRIFPIKCHRRCSRTLFVEKYLEDVTFFLSAHSLVLPIDGTWEDSIDNSQLSIIRSCYPYHNWWPLEDHRFRSKKCIRSFSVAHIFGFQIEPTALLSN